MWCDDTDLLFKETLNAIFAALLVAMSAGNKDALYKTLSLLCDAGDVVACERFAYSTTLNAARTLGIELAAASMDKSNFQFLLRGILVHLDDPAADIQQVIFHTLEQIAKRVEA